MLERALEAATDEPGVERVVAVLDQHRALRETKKGPAGIPELGRSDQHRAVDVMSPLRIRVDGGATVHQGVEERERAVELEPFGTDLQDEEGRVARRFDVEGHELSFFEPGVRTQLRRVDRDLLPRHRLRRAARLE